MVSESEKNSLNRIAQKVNDKDPCYSTLPWPDPKFLPLSYPYTTDARPMDLRQRANLLMTDLFSKQQAKATVVHAIERDPIKSELAAVQVVMERASCPGVPPYSSESTNWLLAEATPLTGPGASMPEYYNYGVGFSSMGNYLEGALIEKYLNTSRDWKILETAGMVKQDKSGNLYPVAPVYYEQSLGKPKQNFSYFGDAAACFWGFGHLISEPKNLLDKQKICQKMSDLKNALNSKLGAGVSGQIMRQTGTSNR